MEVYYDDLTESAIENVFRFLSDRPRLPKWQYSISAGNVLAFLRLGATFADVARRTFKTIESLSHDMTDPSPRALFNVSTPPTMEHVVSALGPDISMLVAAHYRLSSSWARTITEDCTGLRHLHLVLQLSGGASQLAPMLVSRGAQLEVLELLLYEEMERELINVISTRCRQLYRLQICCPASAAPLRPIWQRLRESLRDIELSDGVSISDLMDISKYCNDITHLGFHRFATRSETTAIEALCKHYGDQLELVLLTRMDLSAQALRRIVDACPAVEVDMRAEGFVFDCESMLAMGKAARKLHLSLDDAQGPNGETEMRLIGDACQNLHDISVHTISAPAFLALIDMPKPKLLNFAAYEIDAFTAESLLEALAKKVSTLECFVYIGSLPSMDVLQRFASANPGLQTVRLLPTSTTCACHILTSSLELLLRMPPQVGIAAPAEQNTDVPNLEYKQEAGLQLIWPRIINIFTKCPYLNKLECRCIKPCQKRLATVEDACVLARKGRASVSICGVRYL